jgi:hypothetical protein
MRYENPLSPQRLLVEQIFIFSLFFNPAAYTLCAWYSWIVFG